MHQEPALERPQRPLNENLPFFHGGWTCLLLLLSTLALRAQAVQPLGARALEAFDYQGVTLQNGPLLRQVLEVRDDYLRVPNDDYLKGFRQRAGRPAPGHDLGGWYTPGIFHVFGQVLSGLARMHAGTGDPACREKLEALIAGWSQCLEPDGYFYSTRPPSPHHYIYEKMACGLLDAHRYARHPDALAYLDRITCWAETNLDHSNPYVFNTMAGITEWYTLSENLYRAYLATGQLRYRDYAKSWEYTNYWSLFDAPVQNLFTRSPGYHAYSHVNTLSGMAAAYEVTGQEHYLRRLLHAHDCFQQQQVFATGGYGPAERFVPEPMLLDYLDIMDNHWETQCSAWAAFKMAKALLRFTGDARHGDWIERLVINGLGASLPRNARGQVMYYANHSLSGGAKTFNMPPWPCCAGTRIQAVADYHDLVFFHGADSLCVNLYTPATVTWQHRKTPVTLRQETRFPETDRTSFRLDLPKPDRFTLKLRHPAWLAGPMEITVNQKRVAAAPDARHWVAIERTWRPGDRVEVRLPMRLALERFPAASTNPFPAAVVQGPVVLACRSPQGNPVSLVDFARLDTALQPSPGEPLTHHLAAHPEVLFRPYYDFKENERYFIYFHPDHPWTRIPLRQLKFSPGWSLNMTEDLQTTTNAGASVEYTFTGTRIRWIGRKFDDAGQCEVQIDGKPAGIVDQYDPTRDMPFRHEVRDLTPGEHTIRLTVLAHKNPASKNRIANITGFDVILPVVKP